MSFERVTESYQDSYQRQSQRLVGIRLPNGAEVPPQADRIFRHQDGFLVDLEVIGADADHVYLEINYDDMQEQDREYWHLQLRSLQSLETLYTDGILELNEEAL